ncbi:hypothetical protein [Phycobacter azelaicus]|uniref:hypothetical protein n=1 Tax=Phycobacter azelaicus TaxID=2668075 RepID=UPI001867B323|nr:hypothetical protein [Phycobacter azelaicus]MBE1295625.1 hypothetical protein [Paracoccaceae bacterium]
MRLVLFRIATKLHILPLLRAVFHKLPLAIARGCLRLGLPRLALLFCALAGKFSRGAHRVAWVKAQAFEALGEQEKARQQRIFRLRLLLAEQTARKDLAKVLVSMADLERLDAAAPLATGRIIADHIVRDKGRPKLLKAARKAKKRFRESAFLDHIIALCESMDGKFHGAAQRISRVIASPYPTPRSVNALQLKLLESTWRVVDQIAREQMDWAEAPDVKVPKIAAQEQQPANIPSLSFKERALQRRQRDEYLEMCQQDFEIADTLEKRLAAISDMLRSGVRHVPDYTASYEQARRCLEHVHPEIEALQQPGALSDLKKVESAVQSMCTYMRLAKRLGELGCVSQTATYLGHLSENPEFCSAMWIAPTVLHKDAEVPELAAQVMQRVQQAPPKINADVRAFFQWAMHAHRYEEADSFFEKLPEKLRSRHGVLYYVNILQRQGRFAQALKILRVVHAQILLNPLRVNAYTNYSLIKRTGELRFLIETARLYETVPQPQDPKGLVLVAPRNIDQLRRQPLMVLQELKKQGWAVVPLVEGLLPRQETGIPGIDLLNGAIHANTELSTAANLALPELENFNFVPEKGHLSWGQIDLSHALWEDAAINRRRHSIHWTCPELIHYLSGLAKWTRSTGRVLSYVTNLQRARGIPVCSLVPFNIRLPDVVSRFYCDSLGKPDDFFCVQFANGYQNYFTNFSTNVSQRMVVRNVTKASHVRSVAFPIPENFERYYAANTHRLTEVMERFAPITTVKRSTEGSKGRPPEADMLDERIAAWRAKGGKVACAFGKVVCDSGVPFDGGPAHKDMRDWINHCIRAVQGSDTLLLIKPHPHELNNQIATFPTEYFRDLIDEPLGDNAVFLGHRWFDMDDMRSRMDVGVIYNGTTTIELGLMGIPAILAGHYSPIDYPIGQVTFDDAAEFEALLRFEKPAVSAPDVQERAAMWLDYMANENFTQPYRFHARPVTNKVLYPPYWFQSDLKEHEREGNPAVAELAGRIIGTHFEPGDVHATHSLEHRGLAFSI